MYIMTFGVDIAKDRGTKKKKKQKQMSTYISNCFHAEGVHEVKGYGRQEVKEKPALDVVEHDEPGVVDHLAALVQECGSKVEEDVWNQ